MNAALCAIVASITIAVYQFQDGIHDCADGDRYTSGKPQPAPFNRRFCGWPRWLLRPVTLLSLVALAMMMGDWKKAALLMTLPGAWFIAIHPTTVDAPAMLLGFVAATLAPAHPWAAGVIVVLSGAIHERGPVFAAVYGWNPLLLIGLLGVRWWVKRAPQGTDNLVGHGVLAAIRAHRPYQDWLDPKVVLLALRGVLAWPVYAGTSAAGWSAFAVAMGSRLLGSDTGRFLFWAAPIMIRDMPEVPAWVLALHIATFRRLG